MKRLAWLFVLAACSAPAPAPSAARPMPIAEARRRPVGETVTVEGVVTVPSRVIDAGFAIQDASAGIYVSADSSVRRSAEEVVRVAGRLSENHGLLGIAPTSIEAAGRREVPGARTVRTGEVGEATEGLLIRAEGAVTGPVVDDRPYGWKLTIDDGSGPLLVFVPPGVPFDPARHRAGQRLRVSGLSGQYYDHHEILPRSAGDIEVLAER